MKPLVYCGNLLGYLRSHTVFNFKQQSHTILVLHLYTHYCNFLAVQSAH